MIRPAAFGLLAFALCLGCDPSKVSDDVVKKTAEKVEQAKQAEAKEAAKEEAKEEAKRNEFAVCMADCAAAKTKEPTDRATCRLQCRQKTKQPTQAGDETTASAVLTAFDACETKCADGDSTCRFNCTQTAAASVTPSVRASEVTVRGCSSACLEDLVMCGGKCGAGSDEGSTCSLHCESDVKRCLGHCDQAP